MMSEEEGRRNVREREGEGSGKNSISLFLKSSILIKKPEVPVIVFQSRYQPKGINLLIFTFEFRVWTRHYVVWSSFFRVHHFSPF